MREERQAWLVAAALVLAAVVAIGVVFSTSSGSASGSGTKAKPAATVKPTAKSTGHAAPNSADSSPTSLASSPTDSPSAGAPTSVSGLPAVVRRIDTKDPVVFITIDDGYAHDPALITLMKDRHIPITVFLLTAAVNGDWAYFKKLQAAGATIQDHTLTHPFLSRHPLSNQQHQICGSADIYEQQFSYRPWIFRPPYGDFNNDTKIAAKNCGMKYVALWDASLPHAVLRGGSAGEGKLAAGDIVLVHFRTNFVRDISTLLDQIDSWGLHVGKLEDYLPKA